MGWLQNLIIIVSGFLISRIVVEEELHFQLIKRTSPQGRTSRKELISAILFPAYWFSLFFPNTVVVIALLPLIREVRRSVEAKYADIISTDLVLALIYGANIGGMGSMTGASSNIFFLGYIEAYNVAGKDSVTFFSWLLPGIPITLLLLWLSRYLITAGRVDDKIQLTDTGKQRKEAGGSTVKVLGLNFLFLFVMTGIQFSLKPDAVLYGMNWIDITLTIYVVALAAFCLIWPRKTAFIPGVGRNFYQIGFFTLFILPVITGELLRDLGDRFNMRKFRGTGLRVFNRRAFSAGWNLFFDKNVPNLKNGSRTSFISVGRLLHELPFAGLFFMGVVILFVLLILRLGDDPATSELDGYIFRFINAGGEMLMAGTSSIFSTLIVIVALSVFLTEIINNTTVIVILFAIAAGLTGTGNPDLLFLLLAVTTGSTAAFMSPLASPVNALAFGGVKGISLKEMLLKGFLLNIVSILVLTGALRLLMMI